MLISASADGLSHVVGTAAELCQRGPRHSEPSDRSLGHSPRTRAASFHLARCPPNGGTGLGSTLGPRRVREGDLAVSGVLNVGWRPS